LNLPKKRYWRSLHLGVRDSRKAAKVAIGYIFENIKTAWRSLRLGERENVTQRRKGRKEEDIYAFRI
jgi:phosphosulfolactate synthase (CoM biosynthesis protein A)